MNKENMNKTKAVLWHLIEKGNITSWEAIKEYGATRLSAIIFNLRHKYNMNIETEKICFTDRYGNKANYAKYIYNKEIKLYELPEHQNTKLYIDDKIIIFDHIDGFYSYCWLEEDKNKIVHIKATTLFEEYKDGYKYVKEEK